MSLLRTLNAGRLGAAERAAALRRPAAATAPDIAARVRVLVDAVRADGDAALRRLTRELDGPDIADPRVDPQERQSAVTALTAEQRAAIDTAIDNVRRFHAAQTVAPLRLETMPGVVCERVTRPLSAVGLYVPAGSAPLPSTAIMLAVPAALAACPVRVLCTPPRADGTADPAVVFAATRCGVDTIFKVGGAQAVAAMAYGTARIPKVVKIFGPGNAWVTAAKELVAADPGGAALDMPAGPSEVMIIADETADPRFVALDLLSQAEHGPDSHAVLVTTSSDLPSAVERALAEVLPGLARRAIIERALVHAVVMIVPDLATALAVANDYAPEHLLLQVAEPRVLAADVTAAGSVFLGNWTPESAGDYCSGTNHVLPTYGHARAFSGLSVTDFQRRMTLQEISPAGLQRLAPTICTLARLEGLTAHAAAVDVRAGERA